MREARFLRMCGLALGPVFITAVRISDCGFNGELEVLPKYADANDDCAWLTFPDDDEFLDFNLNEVCEAIEVIERIEKSK